MDPSMRRNRDASIQLRIYRPEESSGEVGFWRINGYLARILIWTAEEWERLEERPPDAQYYPCGVWCALRLE